MLSWSPTTGHFYHAAIHGEDVPQDAVKVSDHRHRQLLDGQRAGRKIIAGADGKPTLTPVVRVTVDTLRKHACMDIRAEARRRILAVASLEQQSNDNAALADLALATAFRDSVTEKLGAACLAAKRRRLRIDAIRAASNDLETKIATWAAAALGKLDVTDSAYWPAEE